MSNVIIEAIGLQKNFKDFWGRAKVEAVKGIDFKVTEGQVFGLLGPNGSGKSTTIKMLLGLLFPTAGLLKVFNGKPNQLSNKKRIGYLPEETYLYDHLTALETLNYFGSFFGLSKSECHKRSLQLLDMVGLSHAANRRVGEFSKGMARRIGLAQALINDPELIILDEPTSGLDPIGCREVKELIKTLSQRGKTVLITSHLLADIEDVVDQIAVLYGGTVQASGSIKELLTINEQTRITFDALDKDSLERITNFLKAEEACEFHIDKPSQGLEEFFLKVVKEAGAQHISTSGALQNEEMPSYLEETKTVTNDEKVEKEQDNNIAVNPKEITSENSAIIDKILEEKPKLQETKTKQPTEKEAKLVNGNNEKATELNAEEKEKFSKKIENLLDN